MIPGTNKKEIQAPEQNHPTDWETWARQLNRWGLSTFAATLLESGGAFAALAAQGLYIGQPLIDPWVSTAKVDSLAMLLENPAQGIAFAQFLRDQSR